MHSLSGPGLLCMTEIELSYRISSLCLSYSQLEAPSWYTQSPPELTRARVVLVDQDHFTSIGIISSAATPMTNIKKYFNGLWLTFNDSWVPNFVELVVLQLCCQWYRPSHNPVISRMIRTMLEYPAHSIRRSAIWLLITKHPLLCYLENCDLSRGLSPRPMSLSEVPVSCWICQFAYFHIMLG